jgi:hypothetical protein
MCPQRKGVNRPSGRPPMASTCAWWERPAGLDMARAALVPSHGVVLFDEREVGRAFDLGVLSLDHPAQHSASISSSPHTSQHLSPCPWRVIPAHASEGGKLPVPASGRRLAPLAEVLRRGPTGWSLTCPRRDTGTRAPRSWVRSSSRALPATPALTYSKYNVRCTSSRY